jgi:hypothetical protein
MQTARKMNGSVETDTNPPAKPRTPALSPEVNEVLNMLKSLEGMFGKSKT